MAERTLPKVAFRGVLRIGDIELPTVVLTTGQRWLGVEQEDLQSIPGLAELFIGNAVDYEDS